MVDDRTRTVNRLHGHLTCIFPGLERELDLGNVGPLVLLTGYQTPAAIRRIGVRCLATWLRNRKVRGADQLATKAVQAAEGQHTAVPGEKITAQLVHSLAKEVMARNEKIAETGKLIEGRFRRHRHADVIVSMPGIGPLLGAEFLAATSGDMGAFGSTDRLAGFALGVGLPFTAASSHVFPAGQMRHSVGFVRSVSWTVAVAVTHFRVMARSAAGWCARGGLVLDSRCWEAVGG